MPLKTTYTVEGVDVLLVKFEKAEKRYQSNKNSKIKRDAAEKDCLRLAENMRDICHEAVGGSKAQLEEVFGGDCRRFHRVINILGAVEFSDINSGDGRWNECKKKMEIVEEVLRQSGMFKPWSLATAPTAVTFPQFAEFLSFEDFEFVPIVEGAAIDTLTFSILPALPLGMHLDERNGVISGHPVEDVEVPTRTYDLTATNAAGSTTTQITFGIRAPTPRNIEYEAHDITVGEEVIWEPLVMGGTPKLWKVEPELPKGLEFDPVAGTIVGYAAETKEKQNYNITASNSSGEGTCTITFGVAQAPPEKISYDDCHNVDLPFGARIYLVPEVLMKGQEAFDATSSLPKIRMTQRKARGTVKAGMLGMKSKESLHKPVASGNPASGRASVLMKVDDRQAWGKNFANNGIYAGAKWAKSKQANWETLIQQGIQPNITFTITPELPEGMSISTKTGVISGKPDIECDRKEFTVKAENEQGSSTTTLIFGVKQFPPEGLKYDGVPEILYEGQMYNFSPSEVRGFVKSWKCEPALPPGVQFDDTNGTISGVPEGKFEPGTWTVSAINDAGEVKVQVPFSVNRRPPKHLFYADVPVDLQLDAEIEPFNPKVTDTNDLPVEVDKFEIAPALPAGMAMDEKTGVITGNPTALTAFQGYTVTATNESGTCSKAVNFGVKVMAPKNLRYPGADDVYGVGEMIILKPKVQGGARSYEIEPALPAGVALNAETGLISGIPKDIGDETEYTITASNDEGGTSTVLTFEVSAPAPKSIAYPEMGSRLVCGRDVNAAPVVIPLSGGCAFEVSPPFPAGVDLNLETGEITGSPKDPVENTQYKVTAKSKKGEASVSLNFSCEKPPENEYTINEEFAQALEEVTDVTNLPKEPNAVKHIADWMIWMVHRAWLNDPSLTIFDFSLCQMPLPHIEPRVAPKLMKALGTNTNIKSLLLQGSNLRNPQALTLAEQLKVNYTLEVLNIETNTVSPDGIKAIAQALTDRPESALNTLRFANMLGRGTNHGRGVEQAVAEMLYGNLNVTKLGFSPADAHWANEINRRLLINQDIERRKRKKGQDDEEDLMAEEYQLSRIIFSVVPDNRVWEVFDPSDTKLSLTRRFVISRRQLPTKEHLQSYAKAQGEPLKFKEVAPVVKDFRTKLLDSWVGAELTCKDNLQKTFDGLLKSWTEKNDRVHLDLRSGGIRCLFDSSGKVPVMEVSEELVEWLKLEGE